MKLVGVKVGKAIHACVVEFQKGSTMVVKKRDNNQRSVINQNQIVWINRG